MATPGQLRGHKSSSVQERLQLLSVKAKSDQTVSNCIKCHKLVRQTKVLTDVFQVHLG